MKMRKFIIITAMVVFFWAPAISLIEMYIRGTFDHIQLIRSAILGVFCLIIYSYILWFVAKRKKAARRAAEIEEQRCIEQLEKEERESQERWEKLPFEEKVRRTQILLTLSAKFFGKKIDHQKLRESAEEHVKREMRNSK